jgi:acyl-CoA dehydrogenase
MTDPREAAAALAVKVAAGHAAEVDRDSRFPEEAFAALRKGELLGTLIPVALGGQGRPLSHAAALCNELAHGCSATAMIYAMHQIQVCAVVDHCGDAPWYNDFLRRVAAEQLLLASVTSEVGTGGRMNDSICAVQEADGRIQLEKKAPSISYGRAADALLITARRTPDSPGNDQVLVTALRDDYTLEQTSGWNALGMRGTCTEGFVMRMAGVPGQVLPAQFADIMAQSMVPVSHLLWGSLWLGIAQDAMARARDYVRKSVRGSTSGAGPAGRRLAQGYALLQAVEARLGTALAAYEAARTAGGVPQSLPFTADMNNLKTTASELCLDVVQQAFRICGINAYRNDSECSLGRHLRDLMSAPLMINNDRIQENTANLLLMHKPSPRIF